MSRSPSLAILFLAASCADDDRLVDDTQGEASVEVGESSTLHPDEIDHRGDRDNHRTTEAAQADEGDAGSSNTLSASADHEPRTFTSPLAALLDVPDACLARPSAESCCVPSQALTTGTDAGEAFTWPQLSLVPRCVDASGGDDVVKTGARADVLLGGDGNDELEGRTGADWLFGGDGADTLHAGAGVDVLLGGNGDDDLRGGVFADALVGGPGSDTISGGQGNDFVWPGAGIDDVEAGLGSDTVVIVARCEVEPGEVLDGGPGYDVLRTVIPLADLEAAGVWVTGFEAVQVVTEVPNLTPDCGFIREDALPDDETPLAVLPAIESISAQQVELVRSFLTDLQPIPLTGCEPIAVNQPAYPLDTTGDGYVYDSRTVVVPLDVEEESADVIAIGERRVQVRSPGVNPTNGDLQFGTYRVTSTSPRVDETLEDGRQKVVSTRGFVLDDDSSYLHWVSRYRPGANANGVGFDTEHLATLLQEDEQARGRPIAIGMWGSRTNADAAGIEISYIRDGKSYPSAVVAGLNRTEFELILAARRAQGFRPISIATSGSARSPWYSAIFVDDPVPDGDWGVSFALDGVPALEAATEQRQATNFVPMQVAANSTDGAPSFTVLWIRRPAGMSVRGRANLSDAQLTALDVEQRQAGYSLRSMSTYTVPNDTPTLSDDPRRHVAIWERYADVWREDGQGFNAALFAAGAPLGETFGLIAAWSAIPVDNALRRAFRDAVTKIEDDPMETDGPPEKDSFGRSIATQASITVMVGNEWLYRRAYTLAPSVHASADVNSVFRLQSTSKSLTGAASVKLIDEAYPSFTRPEEIPVAALVDGDVPSLGALSIRDLLQHYSPWPGDLRKVPYLGSNTVCSSSPAAPCRFDGDEAAVWRSPIYETLPFAVTLERSLPLSAGDVVDFLVEYGDPFASASPVHEYGNFGYMIIDGALSNVAEILGFGNLGDYVQDRVVRAADVSCRFDPAPGAIEDFRVDDARVRQGVPLVRRQHPYREAEPQDVPSGTSPFGDASFTYLARGDSGSISSTRAVSRPCGGGFSQGVSTLAPGGWAASTCQAARVFRALWREGSTILSPRARESVISPCNAAEENVSRGLIAGREKSSHYSLGTYAYGNWSYAMGVGPGGASFIAHHRRFDITFAVAANAGIDLPRRMLDALDVSCEELTDSSLRGADVEYFAWFEAFDVSCRKFESGEQRYLLDEFECAEGIVKFPLCPDVRTDDACSGSGGIGGPP